jgi:hypothetical protein
MTLFGIVLVVDAPVVAGLVAGHYKYREHGFASIAVMLLVGMGLLALAQFGGVPVVGWLGLGISVFVWGLFLLKIHRPILRALSGGRLASESRFSAIETLERTYHVKLDAPLRSFVETKQWRALDARFVATLPSYLADPHTNLKIRFGELAIAQAAADWNVDWKRFEGWLPLAQLVASSGDVEQQFLVVHATAPHRVAMWEHETGKLVPVVASLDELLASLI